MKLINFHRLYTLKVRSWPNQDGQEIQISVIAHGQSCLMRLYY